MLGIGVAAWYLLSLDAPSADFQILTTDSRQIKKFTLPDQTQVWLSNNSELSFDPQLAKQNTRRVKLRGEAYFEVRANARHPFQIETPHGMVEALGTSFNVRALSMEPQMEVQVMSGRVALMRKTQLDQRIEIPANYVGYLSAMQPGRRAALNGKEKVFSSTAAWRTRKVDLTGRPLSEVQEIMRRYSKYRLEFADPRLANCVFTWTLQLDQPEASLQLLAKIGFFRLEKTSPEVFRLVGKACP
jgi:ferric-dicitrate binding protein FerR (iron transport regulator)